MCLACREGYGHQAGSNRECGKCPDTFMTVLFMLCLAVGVVIACQIVCGGASKLAENMLIFVPRIPRHYAHTDENIDSDYKGTPAHTHTHKTSEGYAPPPFPSSHHPLPPSFSLVSSLASLSYQA